MQLDLLDVTLVSIDSAADYKSKSNIRLSVLSRIFPKIIENINFGDILLINPFNKNAYLLDEKFDGLWYNDWSQPRNISWYSDFIIKKLPHLIKTKYYLIIQWDGFPHINTLPGNWNDEFFNYPFIGGGHSVMNGGFSLRNTEVMKKMSEINDAFNVGAEDGFYSAHLNNKWMENKNTPFKIEWPGENMQNQFCDFLKINKDSYAFGWHRSNFLSESNIKEIYRNLHIFSETELRIIFSYISTKECQYLLIEDYMKYFDMEFNPDFFNY